MKLNKFIQILEDIAKNINNPDNVEVEMADCVPVVKPIFENGAVFITDVESDKCKAKLHGC